jgi:hypothetical protein
MCFAGINLVNEESDNPALYDEEKNSIDFMEQNNDNIYS